MVYVDLFFLNCIFFLCYNQMWLFRYGYVPLCEAKVKPKACMSLIKGQVPQKKEKRFGDPLSIQMLSFKKEISILLYIESVQKVDLKSVT